MECASGRGKGRDREGGRVSLSLSLCAVYMSHENSKR